MKIGYYLGNISIHSGGVAPYAWRVLNVLLNHSKNHNIEIVILCTKEMQESCFELITKYQAKGTTVIIKNLNYVERISRILGIALARVFNKFKLDQKSTHYLNPLYRWFASLDIDLLHVPYQTAPIYDLPYPFIVTMHDVQELHFPEFFTPEERAYRAEHYWKSLKFASAVVVSFEHVKKDLIKYFQLSDSKISVCPLPYDAIKLSPPNKEETDLYINKYSNFQEFILYPAQTWQHKNHLSLIKALELIHVKYQRVVSLICTGKKHEAFFPVIQSYLSQSIISRQVHFMGIVPETELCWLYKNCALVVIPTLYEAGSFPLLEAMSLEVPVICSSVTSLPETIGNTQFIFDPLKIEDIACLIIKMLDSQEMRKSNIFNSQKQFKKWKTLDPIAILTKTYQDALKYEI